MTTRATLLSQKSGTNIASSAPDHKTKILQCLTRLNDKATLQKAAEDLSIIIRALDLESLAALVQSICSTGAWEPKPFAKKECLRALGRLPVQTCPVADVVLQLYLGKILGHLKKQLQDSDSLVRDAACEALSEYAWAMAEAAGSPLPGSMASPVVKVIFDCLSEQKREAQLGASQALLMVAPCIGPLDKDLVKLILRMLKSATFQGTAPLLAAIASSSSETHAPVGLLKTGASAFEPYLSHLIGQPSTRRSSCGFDAAAGSQISSTNSGSGIIGCLAAKDWAVRRAAADALRASVLLLGPQLEPEGCWMLGDPGSLTYRCLNALDSQGCKFDKVREARDAARDAASLLQELHRFVQEQGPDGDWPAWISNHVLYSGCVLPVSPMRVSTSSGDLTERRLAAMRTSPISKRFQQAAVHDDVIAEPGTTSILSTGLPDEQTAECSTSLTAVDNTAVPEPEQPAVKNPAVEAVAFEVTLHPSEEQESQQQQQHQQQTDAQSQRQWGRNNSSSSAAAARNSSRAGSRTGSSGTSRPGSATGGRHGTAEQQQQSDPRRLSSRSLGSNDATAAVEMEQPTAAPGVDAERSGASVETAERPVAAAAAVASAGSGVPDPGRPPSRSSSRSSSTVGSQQRQPSRQNSSSSSRAKARSGTAAPPAGTSAAWVGPTQQEWQQMQQQLQQYQQQQAAMACTIQQLQESHNTAIAALQERILRLEQQQHSSADGSSQFPTAPQGSGSPSRLGRSNSNAAAAAVAATPPGQTSAVTPAGPLPAAAGRSSGRWGCELGQAGQQDARMFRSEDWSTPSASNASAGRRPGVSVLDTLSAGHRFSGSGGNTPTSGGIMKGWDSQVQTPSDLDAAYADALHGDKGDVHLLRLIQKTGPVWGKLSPSTCRNLLAVFVKNVKDGVMLHRVLPWLWRLADEVADRPELPVELQQQLLDALQRCPAAEDLQTSEKVALLESTLRTVWGQR